SGPRGAGGAGGAGDQGCAGQRSANELVRPDVPNAALRSCTSLDVASLSDAPGAGGGASQPCIHGVICGGSRSILISQRIALAGGRDRTHRQISGDRKVVYRAAIDRILGAAADGRGSG